MNVQALPSKTRVAASRQRRSARMRIAIFLPNWIGDVVMATPAIRALRGPHPDARIVGILKPYVRGVIDGAPWFDDLIESDSAVLPVARSAMLR